MPSGTAEQDLTEHELVRRAVQHQAQRDVDQAPSSRPSAPSSAAGGRRGRTASPRTASTNEHHQQAQRVRQQERRRPRRSGSCALDGERERQVVGGVGHRDDAERLHDRQPVGEERRNERCAHGSGFLALLGLVNATAQEPARDAEHDAADERDAPAPRRPARCQHALTSQAAADPRMKPMVVPAAVELLMRPRIIGDASSVV